MFSGPYIWCYIRTVGGNGPADCARRFARERRTETLGVQVILDIVTAGRTWVHQLVICCYLSSKPFLRLRDSHRENVRPDAPGSLHLRYGGCSLMFARRELVSCFFSKKILQVRVEINRPCFDSRDVHPWSFMLCSQFDPILFRDFCRGSEFQPSGGLGVAGEELFGKLFWGGGSLAAPCGHRIWKISIRMSENGWTWESGWNAVVKSDLDGIWMEFERWNMCVRLCVWRIGTSHIRSYNYAL